MYSIEQQWSTETQVYMVYISGQWSTETQVHLLSCDFAAKKEEKAFT